jgi:hypothetical protein
MEMSGQIGASGRFTPEEKEHDTHSMKVPFRE